MTPISCISYIARRVVPGTTRILATLVAFHLLAGVGTAAPGDLDPTFGSGGVVVTNTSGTTPDTNDIDRINDLVSTPDGKIVAVGESTDPSNTTHHVVCLVRYNTDGSLDTSFGPDGTGIVYSTFSTDDRIQCVALQSDGKIVVAGSARLSNGAVYALAARYSADGFLDASYGTGGRTLVGFGKNGAGTSFAQATEALIQSGDRTVLVVNLDGKVGLARLAPNGALDASFGSGGVTTAAPAGKASASTYAGAIQWIGTDERILVGGGVQISQRTKLDFFVMRFRSSGAVDATFGSSGTVTTDFHRETDTVWGLAVDASNKVVACGLAVITQFGDNEAVVARYTEHGALDTSFAGDGSFNWNPSARIERAFDVAIQSADGRIVVAGMADGLGATTNTMVMRVTADGDLDTSFGAGGAVVTAVSSDNDYALAVILENTALGERIVAGGLAKLNGGYNFVLTRYEE
jgi:uncharacterized delta-60 repeat protein